MGLEKLTVMLHKVGRRLSKFDHKLSVPDCLIWTAGLNAVVITTVHFSGFACFSHT